MNYLQGSDFSQQNMQNYNPQTLDPNQIQYMIDPLNNKQPYPGFAIGESNNEPNNNNFNLAENNNRTQQDYFNTIKNAQNIANSGEKMENIMNNEESAYADYFKRLNAQEYNNVVNNNLDKQSMNQAYSEMYNPDTNLMVMDQINSKKFDYNNMVKNLNNTQNAYNIPMIDMASDKNNMQSDLTNYYKYFNEDNLNKDIINNKINYKLNKTIKIEEKNLTKKINNILKTDNLVKSNKIEVINRMMKTKKEFPRFKTNERFNNAATIENIFSGLDENEKGI